MVSGVDTEQKIAAWRAENADDDANHNYQGPLLPSSEGDAPQCIECGDSPAGLLHAFDPQFSEGYFDEEILDAYENSREHDVTITGYRESGGEMSCNVYTVVVDGTTYRVEKWATRHGSGEEWVTEDGKNVPSPLTFMESFDDLVVAFDQAFWERWQAEVQPVIDRITAEALAEVAAKQQEV